MGFLENCWERERESVERGVLRAVRPHTPFQGEYPRGVSATQINKDG